MKIVFSLLLILLFSQSAYSQIWQTEAATDRGRLQYYYNGNLGYSVRTSAGGGWAWQLVDGGNNSYFHVEYSTNGINVEEMHMLLLEKGRRTKAIPYPTGKGNTNLKK